MHALIHRWDLAAFYAINNGLSRPALDAFFSFVTELRNYAIPGGVLAAWLWVKGGPRGRYCLLALLLCVGVGDGVSSGLIKHLVRRPRPCAVLAHVLTPHGLRNTLSFPSSHAVNIGGAMLILALNYPAWSWLCALIALLVGFSRIYLGLHYPTDVLAGFALGCAFGWLSWRASRWVEARRSRRSPAA